MTKKTKQTNLPCALAREKLEGRMIGGRFADLANYSALFDRSNDAIFLVDTRNFEILETNPAVSELLGNDRSWSGTSFSSFFNEQEENDVQAWLKLCLKNKSENPTLEVQCFQSKWIEFSCARVNLADYCEVFQVLARDVTEERQKAFQLKSQSLTDAMTGLSNFRSFTSRHLLEHERAIKKGSPYSILFFDVDHFKHYNDRNGHPAGDDALRLVASTLKGCAGRTEFVARYGGEEFVVLCSNADESSALAFAERARTAIEECPFPFGEHQPMGKVSVSVGAATFKPNKTAAQVLKEADAALYQSKKAGRNRVTVYNDGLELKTAKAGK